MKTSLLAFGLIAAGLGATACEFSLRAGGAEAPPANAAAPAAVAAAAAPTPAPKGPPRVWAQRFTRMLGASAANTGVSVAATDAGAASSSGGTAAVPAIPTSPSGPAVVTGLTPFGSSAADADSFMGSIYFLTVGSQSFPDFTKAVPSGTLFTKTVDVKAQKFETGFPGVDQRTEFFSIAYDAPLTVTTDGVYELRMISDDGARFLIDDLVLLANDGVQAGPKEAKGPVHLVPGTHAVRIEYFQGAKPDVALQVMIASAQLKMAERALTTKL